MIQFCFFFSSKLSDSKLFRSNDSKRKERVTFIEEDNTFIWSKFDDLIDSTDHVKENL